MCSPSVFEILDGIEVSSQHEFSDHSPVHFSLKLKHKVKEVSVPAAYDKMIWSEAKCDDFVRALNSAECTSKLDDMVLFIEEATGSEASVGLAVDLCVEALRDAADPIFKKKCHRERKRSITANRHGLPTNGLTKRKNSLEAEINMSETSPIAIENT